MTGHRTRGGRPGMAPVRTTPEPQGCHRAQWTASRQFPPSLDEAPRRLIEGTQQRRTAQRTFAKDRRLVKSNPIRMLNLRLPMDASCLRTFHQAGGFNAVGRSEQLLSFSPRDDVGKRAGCYGGPGHPRRSDTLGVQRTHYSVAHAISPEIPCASSDRLTRTNADGAVSHSFRINLTILLRFR